MFYIIIWTFSNILHNFRDASLQTLFLIVNGIANSKVKLTDNLQNFDNDFTLFETSGLWNQQKLELTQKTVYYSMQ